MADLDQLPIEDLVFADARARLDQAPYAPSIDEAGVFEVLRQFQFRVNGAPATVATLRTDGLTELAGGTIALLVIANAGRLRALVLEPQSPPAEDWIGLVVNLRKHADSVGARLAPEHMFGTQVD